MKSLVNLIETYKYEAIALVILISLFLFLFLKTESKETKTKYYHRNNRINNQVHRGVSPDKAIRGPVSEDPTRYENRKELLRMPPLNPTHLSMTPVDNIRDTIETRTPIKPMTIAGEV